MDEIISKIIKTIDLSDVDYARVYRMYNLFHQFEILATVNGEKVGLWNESMKDHYGWVVSKQSLHLDEPIMQHDTIEFITVADNGTHVTFPRNYFIYKDNKQIGHCASLWTLIDIKNRRITSPKRIGMIPPVFTHDMHLATPENIAIHDELRYITERKVLYSDVDVNNHMNNRKYIEWALDIIDYNIYENYYISDLTIQYQKEVRPLETVSLYLCKTNNTYIVQGRNDDIVYFTIEIQFKRKEAS